uniref:universal stress protein n=1 Tax=Halovivax sp. TaxID=1935978 RepID=UPI0025BC2953
MPTHVLVPTDGTEHATAGLEYSFASFPDASITALYVVDPGRDEYASVGGGDPPGRRAEERGERVLERATDRAEAHGRELRTELRTGEAHTEILSMAAETDVDHVVMGSHGESPITRPFLGHVSEAVVRRSPVSTTIVPESATALR